MSYCHVNLTNVVFEGNKAKLQGGAVYYDSFRPIMNNVTFINNTAPYGPNIASYPVKAVLRNSKSDTFEVDNASSGQVYHQSLKFVLVDYDKQIIESLTSGTLSIVPVSSGAKALGYSSTPIVNGAATFDGVIFQAKPGSKNVEFSVITLKIDSALVNKVYGTPSIQDSFFVNFRYCKPGEADQNEQCNYCSAGSYSLGWNSTSCKFCMENARCLGGTHIYVDKGFWRSSTNSTTMIECLRDEACEGGYNPQNEYPINCQSGYEGILCTDCIVAKGVKYEKLADHECAKCPSPVINLIRILGLGFLVGLYFIIMIVISIKKRRESQASILFRILTNYLQLLTAALSFNLKFPDTLSKLFYAAHRISESSEAFLSFDCFIRDAELTGFTPSVAIFKIFLTGLLPVLLFAFSALICLMVHFCFKKKINLKRSIVISITMLMFLLHPMVTGVGFEIFNCVKVDEGDYRVLVDLDIRCYSSQHIIWCLAVGAPIILIWSIGCPSLAFWYLYKNRKDLQKPHVQQYFLLLYQGLKTKAYYWEFINTLRKIAMISINVFMSTFPLTYAALTAVIALIFLMRVQIALQPYKLKIKNELEIESSVAGTATLFCGVLFTKNESNLASVQLAVLVFLMIINVRFFLFWCLMLLSTVAKKHEILMSAYHFLAACLAKRQFSKELLEINDKESSKSRTNKALKKVSKKKRYKKKKRLIKFGNKRILREETKVSSAYHHYYRNQSLMFLPKVS